MKGAEQNGSAAVMIDPGAPFEHDSDEKLPAKEAAKSEKSEAEKQLESLKGEIAQRDARIKELDDAARYWADRAKVPAHDTDDDEETERKLPKKAAEEDEQPAKFLDDMSVRGLKALRDRGVITIEQFEERLLKIEERMDAKLEQQQRHNQIDAELAKFPDVKDPNSDLFKRSQSHFRQMVADDAAMKNSPAALLAAVRMAKKELDMEAEFQSRSTDERRDSRRERIERQMGERSAAGGSEEDSTHSDPLSPTARAVITNLSRFGATEDGFKKFSNGRGR